MNDEAVVADSETNTSVPSETDSSGKGVYNIYLARDNFFRLTTNFQTT